MRTEVVGCTDGSWAGLQIWSMPSRYWPSLLPLRCWSSLWSRTVLMSGGRSCSSLSACSTERRAGFPGADRTVRRDRSFDRYREPDGTRSSCPMALAGRRTSGHAGPASTHHETSAQEALWSFGSGPVAAMLEPSTIMPLPTTDKRQGPEYRAGEFALGPQPTPSRSTTKTRVSLGPIAPLAPRAP